MKKILVLVVLLTVILAGCGQKASETGDKFAGKSCGEIVAALQQGADKYKADTGKYPENLNLLEGKYFDKVPTCPNGGIYQIDGSGKVFETN